jgi:geranylgeranyl pyrophosphate synthase
MGEIHMDVEQYRSPVAAELEYMLDTTFPSSGLRETLFAFFADSGRLCSTNGASPWFLMPILCCRSASGGEWRDSIPVAVAMEIMGTAADLLDDLQDGDSKWNANAETLHLLAVLLSLPNCALLGLQRKGVSSQKMIRTLQLFNELSAQAGVGQFEDLRIEGVPTVSLEKALRTTEQKSASLMQCCCQLGALMGSDEDALVHMYGRFGWHMGLYAQLKNDLRDVSSHTGRKSDIARKKKTVPIVFALNAPEADRRTKRVRTILNEATDVPLETNAVSELLRDMGAIHFTWLLADIQRRQALSILQEVESRGHDTAALASLLD